VLSIYNFFLSLSYCCYLRWASSRVSSYLRLLRFSY